MDDRMPPALPGFRTLVIGVLIVLGAILVWALAALGATFGILEIFTEA
jgi:hypothetical protein